MWEAYVREKPDMRGQDYGAWRYGSDTPDVLAELTRVGVKTATASAYPVYAYEKSPLPQEGEHSVILDTEGRAVCIIRTTRVTVVPFSQVSAEHAYKEGEGDRSLRFWREVHERFFRQELAEIGQEFREDMPVVLEEFQRVYPVAD